MQCPHCIMTFHANEEEILDSLDDATSSPGTIAGTAVVRGNQRNWSFEVIVCPACRECIATMTIMDGVDDNIGRKVIVWPQHTGRPPVPPEVPDEFKRDYLEACLVLAGSPKASAALSRRCLQFILRGKLGAPSSTLHKEIRWAIDSSGFPSGIVDLLDVPRTVGNRAVHPMLSDAGSIVDVEPWEAEWCLEVIEALYDHIFVLPARNAKRLERLGLGSGADN